MKHIRKFESFKESRKNSLHGSSLILEDEKAAEKAAAPAQSQSEKEILAETPEDKKTKIEDILAKHFPEAKGKLDVDDSPNADSKEGEKKEGEENAEKKEGEGEKKEGEENAEKKEGEEGEKTNEGAILLAITIASLVPAAMEAVGSITNMLKQKFGVNLDEKQMASLKKVNDARAALEKIQKAGKGKFLGKEYSKDNWFEISNVLSKEIGQPDAAFGKGYDDGHGHGHGKPAAPAKPGEEKAAQPAAAKPGEEKPAAAPVKESAEAEQPKKGEEAKEQIEREIAKMRSLRDKLFGSNFAKWMKEKGHALHHAYTSPIRLVLRGIAKVSKKDSKLRDEAVREKVANIIYAITMVGLAGYGIMSTLSHMAGVGEVAQLILKGTEAGLNTSEIRKQALTAILGA